MKKWCFVVMAIGLLASGSTGWAAAAGEVKPIWLAVTTPALVDALAPLAAHRRAEGMDAVISTASPDEALLELGEKPAYLVLVGDDATEQADESWRVPGVQRSLYRWRAEQRKTFTSDSAWGDRDGDLIPDFPVGRLPARTPRQLTRLVKKIIAYERKPPSPADLNLPVWAGVAAYNAFLDRAATNMAVTSVQTHAPDWAQPWILTGDTSHALSGWPLEQPIQFSERLSLGGVLAVLIGHGNRDYFWATKLGRYAVGFSASTAHKRLTGSDPAPPTILLSCNTGDFTGSDDCLAETLLRLPGGPVACIAAVTESHPLPNYYSGLALLQALNEPAERTIGRLWLAAQAKGRVAGTPLIDSLLRNAEGSLEPRINVGKLRRDQPLIYAILGDPATRLRRPKPLEVQWARRGDGWEWKAIKPEGATRLLVQFRQAGLTMPTREGRPKPDQARQQLADANAIFTFENIDELTGDAPWRGRVRTPGALRLIASSDRALYAAVLRLDSLQLDRKKPGSGGPADTRETR